jgi:two-component system chemotaxis response regulator CheB
VIVADGGRAASDDGLVMSAPPNLIVVGASAGGVEALARFVSVLRTDVPAAVLVVLHIAPGGSSVLPGILARSGPLGALGAVDGEPLQAGHIHVAVPDHHLVVKGGRTRLERGPRLNGHRPAVDRLFASAAEAFGERVAAVVLSGARDDGTLGAQAVKARGGRVFVQALDDALSPSMPASVIEHVEIDGQATAELLAPLVVGGLRPAPKGRGEAVPSNPPIASDPPARGSASPHGCRGDPAPSGLTCPECGGALYEEVEGHVARFECPVGHLYSRESLVAEQARALEASLWIAVRSLEERSSLLRRLAGSMAAGTRGAERFETSARDTERHAQTIRSSIHERLEDPA